MGHSPACVWNYTPRQIAGFGFFAARRLKRESAERLAVGANAARGEPKEIKRILKESAKD